MPDLPRFWRTSNPMSGKLIERLKDTIQDGNINFLLGSGLSSPYLGTLGNIEALLTELDAADINGDTKKVIRASLYRRYFTEVIQKNISILSSDPASTPTLDEYKVHLRSWNSILLNRKNTLLSKEINVFTTNIDIFLEMAIEGLSLECNDGFNGRFRPKFSLSNFKQSRFKKGLHYDKTSELPVFNLVKLHGSLCWEAAGAEVIFSVDLKHIKCVEKLLPDPAACVDAPSGATLAAIEAAAAGKAPDKSIDDFLTAYEQLLIVVNPTKEKFKHTLLNQTYYELLRMYSNELERENTVLLVFGFSFADEHIRDITLRAANSNPTLMIYLFAHSSHAAATLRKHLPPESAKNRNVEIIAPEQTTDPSSGLVDAFKYDLKTINERVSQPLLTACDLRETTRTFPA